MVLLGFAAGAQLHRASKRRSLQPYHQPTHDSSANPLIAIENILFNMMAVVMITHEIGKRLSDTMTCLAILRGVTPIRVFDQCCRAKLMIISTSQVSPTYHIASNTASSSSTCVTIMPVCVENEWKKVTIIITVTIITFYTRSFKVINRYI